MLQFQNVEFIFRLARFETFYETQGTTSQIDLEKNTTLQKTFLNKVKGILMKDSQTPVPTGNYRKLIDNF